MQILKRAWPTLAHDYRLTKSPITSSVNAASEKKWESAGTRPATTGLDEMRGCVIAIEPTKLQVNRSTKFKYGCV